MVVLLGLLVVALLAPTALAEKKEKKAVKPTKTWSGSVADEALAKDAPESITERGSLEKLWKKWQIAGDVPEVDFQKELVVLATTVGSRLSLDARLDDRGNLQVLGVATRDIRPGFRYVIATVPREGINKVNGKELKAK
jgi:hypothetical protein